MAAERVPGRRETLDTLPTPTPRQNNAGRTCPVFDQCTECTLCVELGFCECHDCFQCGYIDCDGHP